MHNGAVAFAKVQRKMEITKEKVEKKLHCFKIIDFSTIHSTSKSSYLLFRVLHTVYSYTVL